METGKVTEKKTSLPMSLDVIEEDDDVVEEE